MAEYSPITRRAALAGAATLLPASLIAPAAGSPSAEDDDMEGAFARLAAMLDRAYGDVDGWMMSMARAETGAGWYLVMTRTTAPSAAATRLDGVLPPAAAG